MEFITVRFAKGATHNRLESGRLDDPGHTPAGNSWQPRLDLYETPDKIIIIGEMAGVKQDDLVVEMDSTAVRIYGTRKERLPETRGPSHIAEIRYGPSERVVPLPSAVDPNEVTASFTDGLLEISMAKRSIRGAP